MRAKRRLVVCRKRFPIGRSVEFVWLVWFVRRFKFAKFFKLVGR